MWSDSRPARKKLNKRHGDVVFKRKKNNSYVSAECVDNKIRATQSLFGRYKHGANIRYLKFDLSLSKFSELIGSDCHYCGVSPFRYVVSGDFRLYYNGIDRINSDAGYVDGNVVPCCTECNKMKLNTPYNDFLDKIEAIYSNLCNVDDSEE